jgi:hypothetical protein
MHKRIVIIASVACVLAVFLISCGSERPRQGVEVTTTDFTGAAPVTSTKLLTFGVALGDSEISAKRMIERAGLKWEPRPAGDPYSFSQIKDSQSHLLMRVHTYAGRGDSAGTLVRVFRRLRWGATYDNTVDAIRWNADMKSHLAGNNRLLLDTALMEPDSPLRQQLLGGAGDRTAERGMGGRLEFVRYSFPQQGFIVKGTKEKEKWAAGLMSFDLVPPKE